MHLIAHLIIIYSVFLGEPKFDLISGELFSLEKIVAALRAGAEYARVPFKNCVLVAGSQMGVSGADQIGMPCIVLRCR